MLFIRQTMVYEAMGNLSASLDSLEEANHFFVSAEKIWLMFDDRETNADYKLLYA